MWHGAEAWGEGRDKVPAKGRGPRDEGSIKDAFQDMPRAGGEASQESNGQREAGWPRFVQNLQVRKKCSCVQDLDQLVYFPLPSYE